MPTKRSKLIYPIRDGNGVIRRDFVPIAATATPNVALTVPTKQIKPVIIKTAEICPVCQCENMRVEHGIKDERGRPLHHETCSQCGESWPIVGYDCMYCKAAYQNQAERAKPTKESEAQWNI